ncbi:uncharacterized protein [Eurosta solidaginis]|uniref:uncharacterized protein n=1 Tax=Eurosta solidaginis TaxID=178769 RepID=UPI003530B227
MNSTYLKKLLLKSSQTDHKHYIFLHSEWQEDIVNLYLKDSITKLYYKGQLVAKDFEEAAVDLEIPLNDFQIECKNVLTTNIAMPGFEIELDTERKVLMVNKNEEFCKEYLEIKLSEAEKNYEMLDIALNIIDHSRNGSETEKSNETVANLVEEVEEILREKEEWKQKMLNKFLVLLNTKKYKILNLQQKIEKMEKRIDCHDRQSQDGNAKNSSGATNFEGVQMDYDAGEHDKSSNACDEQDDFDAPTQRITPPIDIE